MVGNQKSYNNKSDRITILSEKEEKEIFKIPNFKKEEQSKYFDLTYYENEYFKSIKSIDAKILFVLQLGYFKTKFQFFPFKLRDVIEDVVFISKTFLDGIKINNLDLSSGEKNGRLQRLKILEILNFKEFKDSQDCKNYLSKQTNASIDPKFLFELMFDYLIRNRYVIPKYYVFQLIIRDVIKTYENNLKETLSFLITKEDEKKIEEILQLKDEKGYISKLAFIKTSAKGFNKSYVEEEIKKRRYLEKLFPRAKEIIQKLELSESTVQKYAKFIDAYHYSHIKRLENKDLYVLCFVYYRYLRSNDDMMRTFIYWINKYHNDVQRKIDETILKENMENNKLFPWVAKLIKFVYTKDSWKNLSHDEIWDKLTKFLDIKQAEKIQKYFEKSRGRHNDLRWFLYKELHGKIQGSARQFLRNVKLSYSAFILKIEPELVNFIEYYQSEIQKETPKVDWDKYPFNKNDKEEKLTEDNFKLKEIQLFNRINKYIKFGEIYLEDSIEFRHLELDLIPKSEFYKNKDEILSKMNLPYIQEPLSKIIIHNFIIISFGF